MNDQTILEILDVFQIDGRGTVVTGRTGDAWKSAKPGDHVTLRTPAGNTFATAIKDMEPFLKGRLDPTTPPAGGTALFDVFTADQLPSGSLLLR